MSRCWWRAAFLGFVILSAPTQAVKGDYVVVDIGVISSGGSSSGLGLNASGIVVGSGQTADASQHAIKGNGLGAPTDIGMLTGGRFSNGRGINALGVVAGESETLISPGVFAVHAFRGSSAGMLQDLGVLPGTISSEATGINGTNMVSGFAQKSSGLRVAFVGDASGHLTGLGTLPGGDRSQANGINGSGTIVGSAGTGLTLVGNLSGGTGSSAGLGINNSGEVVGFAGTLAGNRAVRSLSNGTLENLGVLAGGTASSANAVNDLGVIVGSSSGSNGSSRAFIFTDATKILDLNLMIAPGSGWVLNTATGINNLGQISGTGLFHGQVHAFRLDPTVVPEPGALALFGIGGLGLLAIHARGKRIVRPEMS